MISRMIILFFSFHEGIDRFLDHPYVYNYSEDDLSYSDVFEMIYEKN
jgi:hypothetical protein